MRAVLLCCLVAAASAQGLVTREVDYESTEAAANATSSSTSATSSSSSSTANWTLESDYYSSSSRCDPHRSPLRINPTRPHHPQPPSHLLCAATTHIRLRS